MNSPNLDLWRRTQRLAQLWPNLSESQRLRRAALEESRTRRRAG